MTGMGCCGAYCETCREYGAQCKGCQDGYREGTRDLGRARCKIKICCISKAYTCCAVCPSLDRCPTVQEFYGKGYKYQRYQKTIQFIRKHGYEAFARIAADWKGAYGKLPHEEDDGTESLFPETHGPDSQSR